MTADWYFILALLGPMIGLLFVLCAIPLLIYSLFARNALRSFTASRIALILSVLSVLISSLLWIELISGKFRNGDPVNYRDPDFSFYIIIAALEAVTLVMSLLLFARRKVRHASSTS